jgi:hypothetical protein
MNKDSWRLDDNQVESARAVLAAENGAAIKIILIEPEDGISVIAFAMKEAVDAYGTQVAEVAMDSTCKSNKANNHIMETNSPEQGRQMLQDMNYMGLLEKPTDRLFHLGLYSLQ